MSWVVAYCVKNPITWKQRLNCKNWIVQCNFLLGTLYIKCHHQWLNCSSEVLLIGIQMLQHLGSTHANYDFYQQQYSCSNILTCNLTYISRKNRNTKNETHCTLQRIYLCPLTNTQYTSHSHIPPFRYLLPIYWCQQLGQQELS